MAAGIATLTELRKPGQYAELERKSQLLGNGIAQAIRETGTPAQLIRIGAMFCLYFTQEPVTDYVTAKRSDTLRFARFFWNMLARGIYLPPSQFEACFISLALDNEMIDETIKNVELALLESL